MGTQIKAKQPQNPPSHLWPIHRHNWPLQPMRFWLAGNKIQKKKKKKSKPDPLTRTLLGNSQRQGLRKDLLARNIGQHSRVQLPVRLFGSWLLADSVLFSFQFLVFS